MKRVRTTRREALGLIGASTLAGAHTSSAAAIPAPMDCSPVPEWPRGVEGQRKADLGTTFLNPIVAGDRPDPSILKDGKDYYMVFSTFEAYPGLTIWHSTDLINWRPRRPTLQKNIGSVWAPDLCRHAGRYFIYVTTNQRSESGSRMANWVLWADAIDGPWSDPVDLGIPRLIDPGHAVGEDGTRWLFLSGGNRVQLTPDGLSRGGDPEHVYDTWEYPDEWQAEGPALEGPKITRHGGYYHLLWANGGTAGPATSHMVIAARSRSINGPWQHHPRNPLVHTASSAEPWWSRGHATLVEGPSGDWWGVYHGYEKGYHTLGRQTLLAPVAWSDDGWPEFGGGDLSSPIAKPRGGHPGPHGLALSDDFSTDKYGSQWFFFQPSSAERGRLSLHNGWLHLAGAGTSPATSSPLVFTTGDRAYELDCEVEIDSGARGGLLLFYDHRLYCGVSLSANEMQSHKYGEDRNRSPNRFGNRLFVRLRNQDHVARFSFSKDRANWTHHRESWEVSGYNHNTRGGFLALKPALYAAGTGTVRFRDLRYRAL